MGRFAIKRAIIDTSVLVPTVQRQLLYRSAELGLFCFLWSDSILDEWHHVSSRREEAALIEMLGWAAKIRATFPDDPQISINDAALWLPDNGDIHVLKAAIERSANFIVTSNRKDFPSHILGEYDIVAISPDDFLLMLFRKTPSKLGKAAEEIRKSAVLHGHEASSMRAFLKRARLPRFAKASESFAAPIKK